MELKLKDLRDDYVGLVRHVIRYGELVSARGIATRELTAVTLIFPDVLEPMLPVGVGRGVNTKLAALEALQLISGVSRFDLVQVAAPTFGSVLVDVKNPDYGAYGPRIVEQLADCVDLLKRDQSSRQAVCAIWNMEDLRHEGDKPCTVFLQFLVRNSEHDFPALELHTHMRSQDVWLGVPYDVFMFTQLQHTVAQSLSLPVGRYVHHTSSLHIYERDVVKAEQLHSPLAALNTDQLPLGVVAGVGMNTSDLEDGFNVAAYILEGNTTDAEEEANAWYVAQLDEVEVLLTAQEEERKAITT